MLLLLPVLASITVNNSKASLQKLSLFILASFKEVSAVKHRSKPNQLAKLTSVLLLLPVLASITVNNSKEKSFAAVAENHCLLIIMWEKQPYLYVLCGRKNDTTFSPPRLVIFLRSSVLKLAIGWTIMYPLSPRAA